MRTRLRAYCLDPKTLILLGNGATRPISDVHVGDSIYGTERQGGYRRYVRTRVLAHWSVVKPAYKVTLADGTEITAGGDHRFLTERGWKHVTGAEYGPLCRPHLTTGNKLMGTGTVASPAVRDHRYRFGYLCGLIRGDAYFHRYPYLLKDEKNLGWAGSFRLALCDQEALDRAVLYLARAGVEMTQYTFAVANGNRRELQAIAARASQKIERVRQFIAWPYDPCVSWRAGFLAGIFDAEGSYSDGCLRISNTDATLIQCVCASCLASFGFEYVFEQHSSQRQKADRGCEAGGVAYRNT